MRIYSNDKVVGEDNPFPVRQSGSLLQEQLTEAAAETGVLTFSEDISTIEIDNTDTNDGAFVVNGITLNVPAGKTFKATLGGTPGPTVTITGATTYIVSRYT